jgi:hypothetical protein
MSPETYRVLCAVFALWGVAVAIKAVKAIRTGEPYVFSLWDGGMIRAGKSLKPIGAKVKAVVGVGIAIGSALFAARIASRTEYYALIALLVVSVIADFALSAD